MLSKGWPHIQLLCLTLLQGVSLSTYVRIFPSQAITCQFIKLPVTWDPDWVSSVRTVYEKVDSDTATSPQLVKHATYDFQTSGFKKTFTAYDIVMPNIPGPAPFMMISKVN